MSDFQKVQLFTINTDVSVDMKHDIYSIEVPEDQIEEFKAKDQHAEGEVRVLDDKILAKAQKKGCTRFFRTFIKGHLELIRSVQVQLDELKDLKKEVVQHRKKNTTSL